MKYYKARIAITHGQFEYNVPDVQQITGAKYQWPKNDETYCTCCFIYPESLADHTSRTEITEQQYNEFEIK